MSPDQWIDKEFQGLGVAIRKADGEPVPGEPFISMDEAKRIVRKALAPNTPESAGTKSEFEKGPTMNDEQVKYMVDRFLSWKLPEQFNPDGGIIFDANAAIKLNPRNRKYEPVGTNLFSATQADEMVRHMLEGLPSPAFPDAGVRENGDG